MTKKTKGPADLTLNRLWSKACMKLTHGSCYLCGAPAVQTHHLVPRRRKLLRWDVENGMPLCVGCHREVHAAPGMAWAILPEPQADYLKGNSQVVYKQWLQDNELTDEEFRQQEYDTIMRILRGDK